MKHLIALLFVVLAVPAPVDAAELIMMEQDGCHYCELFDEEIGEAYPKTTEGKLAPLRKIDIHETKPDDLSDIAIDYFTPTFVLVDNGVEIGRIRGYPGDEFFWGLLSELLEKLPRQSG